MGIVDRIHDKVDAVRDKVSAAREYVEDKHDRADSYVKEKVVYAPRRKAQNRAASHWARKNQDIDAKERSGNVSPRLAQKWRERENDRYDKRSKPFRERAYEKTSGWGQNFKQNFSGDLSGGYKKSVYDRRTGKTAEVYVPPAKERIRRSMYGDNGKGGASKSYRKTVPREFGIARNQDQFGNVVMFGKPTRGSSSKMGGGWGMMFGSGSSVRSFDSSRSSGGRRRKGRKGRGGDSIFLGNTGWLF